jgi:hypothetical protein
MLRIQHGMQLLHRNVYMLTLQQERRQEAQDVALHDVEHQALFECGFGERTTGLGELKAENQAASAGFHGDGAGHGQLLKLCQKVRSRFGNLGKKAFFFDDVDELQAEAARHGASAECAAVLCNAERVEELFVDQQSAQRNPAAEWLAQDQSVGLDAGARKGEPLAGAAEAGLNLVEDQQSAELVGECEAVRGRCAPRS